MLFHVQGVEVTLPLSRMERMVVRSLYRKNRHYSDLPNRADKDSVSFGTVAAREHVTDVLLAMTASRVSERQAMENAAREFFENVDIEVVDLSDIFGPEDLPAGERPVHGDYRDMGRLGDNPNGYL